MQRIALTGGIATGKSYVRRRLAEAGVPTIDADALVHDALAGDPATIAAVVARFGSGIAAPDGAIDRRALGILVFDDAQARADLEAILHPRIYRLIDDWFVALADSGRGFGVADIPLLYETRHETFFDRVIVAACPPDEQIRRLRRRDAMSEEEARSRLAAQWPIDEKVRRADFVIDTSGTFEGTNAQVDGVLARLRQG